MKPKTKLEIIGPYTPEYDGPFCCGLTDPVVVDLRVRDGRGEYPLLGYIGDSHFLSRWRKDGTSPVNANLMNAREVPVAREFWVNEYPDGSMNIFKMFEFAREDVEGCHITRTIHVREVLPGDGE